MTALSPEDIKGFIVEKWTNAPCPRCGERQWTLGEDRDDFKAILPLGRDEDGSFLHLRKSLPASWAACVNCGHVELIAIKVIQKWKNAKREG